MYPELEANKEAIKQVIIEEKDKFMKTLVHGEKESQDILKEKIEQEINKVIEAKELSLFVFVITDIVNSNSTAIVLGDRTDAISKTYEIKDNLAEMPGVVSRKKQVLPLIEKNI